MMNEMTASLYEKVASVKQHSMVQRSMILNFYQDYCEEMFYSVFRDCHEELDEEGWIIVPTMSDTFGTLLEKLNVLEWDADTYQQFLDGPAPTDITGTRVSSVFINSLSFTNCDHYLGNNFD